MAAVPELSIGAGRANGLAHQRVAFGVMLVLFLVAPLVAYPIFLMKVMCFALFACAFNLLIGYGGLLSFRILEGVAARRLGGDAERPRLPPPL